MISELPQTPATDVSHPYHHPPVLVACPVQDSS
jgi:hypothetical protein